MALSGGMDSTSLLLRLLREGYSVSCISYEYGQKHRVEIDRSKFEDLSKDLSDTMGSTIKFDYKVDENLIGGLKLQLGSFMIDTSVKNKLKKFLN